LLKKADQLGKSLHVEFITAVVGVTTLKRARFTHKTGRNPFRDVKPPFGKLKNAGGMLTNNAGIVLAISAKPKDNEGLVLIQLDTPLRKDIEVVAIPVEPIEITGGLQIELSSNIPSKHI